MDGARGGDRTRTAFRPEVFETSASANSATRALGCSCWVSCRPPGSLGSARVPHACPIRPRFHSLDGQIVVLRPQVTVDPKRRRHVRAAQHDLQQLGRGAPVNQQRGEGVSQIVRRRPRKTGLVGPTPHHRRGVDGGLGKVAPLGTGGEDPTQPRDRLPRRCSDGTSGSCTGRRLASTLPRSVSRVASPGPPDCLA